MVGSASQYLRGLIRTVETYGGRFPEAPAIEVLTPEDDRAFLRATASFPDGSRLSVSVLVDTSGPEPLWRKYRLHYMNAEGACLFRYDDAPHHPNVVTFPHHKHEGPSEIVVESLSPDLTEVLEEIRKLMPERDLFR